MDNQAIVNPEAGTNNVNQRADVVNVIPPSYLVFGILPFPVEVHGNSNLLLRRQDNAFAGLHDCMPIGIRDFAIRTQGLGKRDG